LILVEEVMEDYSSKVCSFSGKTGHVIDTCYRKHGFPP